MIKVCAFIGKFCIVRKYNETVCKVLWYKTLTWAVSKGTDIGGIATPIGASANVTGVALAAKEGHPISWKRYCKYAMPAAVLVLVVSMVLILALH